MTDVKEKVLDNISKAINMMDESQKDYMIGFSDGLAASVGLCGKTKEKEDAAENKEEQPS